MLFSLKFCSLRLSRFSRAVHPEHHASAHPELVEGGAEPSPRNLNLRPYDSVAFYSRLRRTKAGVRFDVTTGSIQLVDRIGDGRLIREDLADIADALQGAGVV